MTAEIGYRDRDGTPIDVRRWAQLSETPDYRVVAHTEIGHHRAVRTIWLGIVHPGHGLFGTAVFSPGVDRFDIREVCQYPDQDAAVHGHGYYVGLFGHRFWCPRCRRISANIEDLRHGYCGACHDWTAPTWEELTRGNLSR